MKDRGMAARGRIGIVMPIGTSRGGAEMMLLNLLSANRLLPAPADYAVCLLEDGPMAETIRDWGYPVKVIPAGRVRHVAAAVGTVMALRRWLIEARIDSALSWMAKAHLYLAPAAMLARVPSAWFQHELPGDNRLHRLVSALPTRMILACSHCVAAQQRVLTPQREIHVVNPSVDLDRFALSALPDAIEARRRLMLPVGGPVIGIVARLQRWKGVHVLLSAAPAILKRHPSAYFVVVGGEHFDELDYPAELAEQVRVLGIGNRVKLAGFQSDIPLWTQALDVAVVASDTEPFGMSAIEAMALGKLLAAYRAGGFLETVEDEVSGKFFETRDGDGLAAAVCWLLDDPLRAQRIRLNAMARAAGFGSARLAQSVADRIGQLAVRPVRAPSLRPSA